MKLNEVKKGKSVADLGKKYEGGMFDCQRNNLTSLVGAPREVDGYFDCDYNNLTSLEGAPQVVRSSFYSNNNELTTLKGAPQEVGRNFWCDENNLTSLEGAPQKVGGDFHCEKNKLTSLEGAPQEVAGSFWCNFNNELTSLKNIHKYIKRIDGNFSATECPIQSHVLGLLLIKDLESVTLDNEEVAAIINAHLDGGSMRSAMDCQHALIKAGYTELAKL